MVCIPLFLLARLIPYVLFMQVRQNGRFPGSESMIYFASPSPVRSKQWITAFDVRFNAKIGGKFPICSNLWRPPKRKEIKSSRRRFRKLPLPGSTSRGRSATGRKTRTSITGANQLRPRAGPMLSWGACRSSCTPCSPKSITRSRSSS
jgi:hypothetical protein